MYGNDAVHEATDGRFLDKQPVAVLPAGGDGVPTPAGNAIVGWIRGALDAKVGDTFGTLHIADAGGQANDNAKVMKGMQQVFDKAISDPERQSIFHDRLEAIQKFDPKTFEDMARIASKIGGNPPLSAAEAGTELATAMQETIKRHSGPGKPADLGSNEMVAVFGGMNGLMLTERGTFDPSNKAASTAEMVDKAEAQLRTQAGPDGIMKFGKQPDVPVNLHGVTWGDNGEPALLGYPDNYQVDRHKYEIGV